ncbi:MAG: hypothetical protein JWP19_1875 [Rhodoglobus sp.]|jgi:hypothetical protein|nr:hypothetical protein [Rhodoglobus sp.]
MSASYPTRSRRTALAPGILAAIALLVGVALIASDGFTVIRYVVSILALIVAWFAWQARQWWWIVGLVPIAVLWNPVFPIDLGQPDLWLGLQYVAVLVFLAAGILIKVADTDGGKTPAKGAKRR